jgi:aspartate racemase
VLSDPRVPDRVGPIVAGRGPSPLPALLAGVRRLERAGAQAVAIPCHTAHFWYDELAAATALPILSIVDATLAELARLEVPPGPLGLLATGATLEAGLYQQRLAAAGHPPLVPLPEVMGKCVLPAIALVKRDRAAAAAPLLARAVGHLRAAGAAHVLLACTELPLALAAAPLPCCIDATEALARACLAWWRAR